MERKAKYNSIRLRPVSVYDLAAQEAWLEDLAARGYELVSFGRIFGNGKFRKTAPQPCRYRLEPIYLDEESPEIGKRELYQQMGWEYVTTLKGWYHVWRCANPEIPELNTDPVAQEMGYKYMKKRMWEMPSLLVILLGLVIVALRVIRTDNIDPLRVMIESQPPGQIILASLAILCVVLLEIWGQRNFWKRMKHLRDGIPLTRPKTYKAQKYFMVIIMVLWFFVVFEPQAYFLRYPWDAYDGIKEPPAEAVYADIQTLDGLAEDEVEYWRVQTKVYELAPRAWYIRQVKPQGKKRRFSADTEYYRMLTTGLAEILTEELRLECGTKTTIHPMEAVAAEGLDAFLWGMGEDNVGEVQFVVAALDSHVIGLQYRGEADLRTQEGYFAELLSTN